VRAFQDSKKRPWSKKPSKNVDVQVPVTPSPSILATFREFMAFEKDFAGFCSILTKCTEFQEKTKSFERVMEYPSTQSMD
jgi:hypothetical protein